MPPTRRILTESTVWTRRTSSSVADSPLWDDAEGLQECNQTIAEEVIQFSVASHPIAFWSAGRSGGLSVRFVLETGADAVVFALPKPRPQAGMYRFAPPDSRQGDSGVSTLSMSPYRTMTHPVVEIVPLVGAQAGQGQPR